MATKNNGITRAKAIELALTLVNESAQFDDSWTDVADVLTKMHDQLTAPRKATISKARKANEKLAAKVRDAVSANGDGMSTKDIVDLGIVGITTTQKAAAVCKVACEVGYLTKCVNGKAITYAIA